MAFAIIAEALARVEHKIDLLLKLAKLKDKVPMQFIGQECPVCEQLITYQIDLVQNVVVRRCQCTTGKVPPTSPLFPSPQSGETNGNPSAGPNTGSTNEGQSSHRHRR